MSMLCAVDLIMNSHVNQIDSIFPCRSTFCVIMAPTQPIKYPPISFKVLRGSLLIKSILSFKISRFVINFHLYASFIKKITQNRDFLPAILYNFLEKLDMGQLLPPNLSTFFHISSLF